MIDNDRFEIIVNDVKQASRVWFLALAAFTTISTVRGSWAVICGMVSSSNIAGMIVFAFGTTTMCKMTRELVCIFTNFFGDRGWIFVEFFCDTFERITHRE